MGGFISTNTTWNNTGNPYIVTSNINVDAGVELTIEPGTIVKFDKNKTLIVDGTIRALGTPAEPISFDADTVGAFDFFWSGIYLSSLSQPFDYGDSSGSFFQFCNFFFAGTPNLPVDASGNTSFTVYSEVSLGFDHCEVTSSACGLVGGPSSQVSYNFFKECAADGLSGSLIKTGGNSVVFNNLLYKNAMAASSGLITLTKNVKVYNNLMIENEFVLFNAFYFSDSSKFYGNTFADNIGAFMKIGTGSVYENTITRNEVEGETILLGDCDPDLHNNNISGNETNLQFQRELTASGGGSVAIAENNFWGYTDSSQVAEIIKDQSDQAGLCKVDFLPLLSSPEKDAPLIPPVNVLKKDLGNGNLRISWSVNSESDLAGYRVHRNGYTGYSFTEHFDAGAADTFILAGSNINDVIAVTAYDSHADGTDDQYEGNESWFTLAQPDSVVSAPMPGFTENLIEVFPNPSNGSFRIRISENDGTALYIYDVKGKMVYEEFLNGSCTRMIRISNAGVYFLHTVSEKSFRHRCKLVVLP